MTYQSNLSQTKSDQKKTLSAMMEESVPLASRRIEFLEDENNSGRRIDRI
jgi:hypothetical protein